MDGLNSDWYAQQAKAPWMPPAWFFGVAWTTIMVAFAVYMAKLSVIQRLNRFNWLLYVSILLLCVVWNAVFFAWRWMMLGALILVMLCLSVVLAVVYNNNVMRIWGLLLLPFILWTAIATSLNIYSVIYNLG